MQSCIGVLWTLAILGVGVWCIPRFLTDMKTKDKDKGRMATIKSDILTPSESTSRKEVGVQDSACTTIPSGTTPSKAATEVTPAVLDKLVVAVDSVAGKLSSMENRLIRLESQAVTPRNQLAAGAGISTDPDEPYFMSADQPVVKPKHRRIKQVASDVDTVESDSNAKSRKKKRPEKKATHAVKTLTQDEVHLLSKSVDKTLVQKQPMPLEGAALTDVGLLTQREIEELSEIALNAPTMAQAPTTQATQI